jgi:hypothetical protein
MRNRRFTYETMRQPLLPRRDFYRRLLWHIALACAVLGGSLAIGWVGYAFLDHLSPVDAFVNAAMILGGMGPVDPLSNDTAKWFAGVYALYAGVIFLVSVSVIIAPVLHRLLHALHLDTPDDDSSSN